MIAQLFGLFPLDHSKNPDAVQFKWKSLRTIYSLLFLLSSISVAFLVLYKKLEEGSLSPSNIVGFIFFGNCACACFFFLLLSQHWRKIMIFWSKSEQCFSNEKYNNSAKSWSLKKRIKVCLYTMLLLALLEHLLFLTSTATNIIHRHNVCNITEVEFVKHFITIQLYHVFSVIPYTHLNGAIAEYLNVSFTFYWSFVDLFLMLISIGISTRYQQINERIKNFNGRVW